jgi:diguanylate cyclase (GGDEF)-like protein
MKDEDYSSQIRSLRTQAEDLNKRISENIVQLTETSPETAQELVELLEQIKQAGAELEKRWQELQAANVQSGFSLESAPGGFLKTDEEGLILEADHALAVLLHTSQRRLCRKLISSFIPIEEQADFYTHLAMANESNTVVEWKTHLKLRDEVTLPALITVFRTQVVSGETPMLRWLVRDIAAFPQIVPSQLKIPEELERRVQQRTEELLKANQKLGQEIEHRKKAESDLRKVREVLEVRVKERTGELAITNEMLQAELMERERAERAAAQRARELTELHKATEYLLTTIELEPLLGNILDAVTRAIPEAEKGLLYLMARDTGQLEMRAIIGYNDERIQSLPREKFGYVAKAVEERMPQLVTNAQDDPLRSDEGNFDEMRSIRSAIVAPLILKNEVIGALSLESPKEKAFSKDDLRVLVTFAATATAAIRNAQLHGEVQKLALTDTLTNVYNRRGFMELSKREVERARRFGRPLSAIMVDVDHFKEINDTYGHAEGDRILRMVAERLNTNIREIDILGRYGGDEFTIILPETDLFVATNVAERVRRSVAEIPTSIKDETIRVSLSIGVARANPETADLMGLLESADAAMYIAKQAGGNRVEVG